MDALRLVKERPRLVSYAFDYAVVIVCIGGFSALDLAEPHHQQFALNDVRIQNPYATDERVPAAVAGVIAVLVPIVLMTMWCLTLEGRVLTVRKPNLYGRLWELNSSILGLLLSVGLALVTTNIMKNTVGRPRPDLIDRCQPVDNAASLATTFGLSNITICTQTDHSILKDGYRSFPSGHSSSSFSGLGYFAIWLAGKLRTQDGSGQIWKVAIVTVPIMAATLIAASRIMDARHHPFDVFFGSALGIAAAWISYRQYYPALRVGSLAYGPRTFGSKRTIDNDGSMDYRGRVPLHPYPHAREGHHDAQASQASRDGVPKILIVPPAQSV